MRRVSGSILEELTAHAIVSPFCLFPFPFLASHRDRHLVFSSVVLEKVVVDAEVQPSCACRIDSTAIAYKDRTTAADSTYQRTCRPIAERCIIGASSRP